MTPNKKWFDTYMLVKSSSVFMGNDASCKMGGIGSIKVKMFDGIIRTLCDVKHVPDLRNYMISLGTLDGNSFDYISTNGVMKVRKGVMIVIKGQKLVGNIYKLMGTIILGRATVSTSIHIY